MLGATVVGTVLGLTDVWDDFISWLPALGHLGTLLSTAIIAAMTLRMRLLDVVYTRGMVGAAGILGMGSVAAHVVAFHQWRPETAMMILAAGLVGITALVLVNSAARAANARADRARQLALLGRFSAQMSHDLRNPLAALKGSVQYLQAELGSGRTSNLDKYLGLMSDQIERIQRALELNQRIASVEPQLSVDDLNRLMDRLVALQRFAAPTIEFEAALEPTIPPMLLDCELLTPALENVFQNAIEAMPRGGVIRVRTALVGESVCVTIHDSGRGMDPRQTERALDEFFATKSSGSGLGLTFVKRVVEAHGGRIAIKTKLNAGTAVELELPIRAPAAPPSLMGKVRTRVR